MTNLLKFILNVDSLEGTKLAKFIELGTAEKAPEVYKPRKGVIGRNNTKFSPAHIEFILSYAPELLEHLDYTKFMVPEILEIPETDLTWVENFNKESLKRS